MGDPLQKTLKIICTEGFDHRVANLHGSLGGGKPAPGAQC